MAVEVVSTLKPSGGDYTSINAWVAATKTIDWVGLDQRPVLEVYDGDYTAVGGGLDYIVEDVDISGYTSVDATHYPEVRAAPGHGYRGDPASGFCVRNATGAQFSSAVIAKINYTVIRGIRVQSQYLGNNALFGIRADYKGCRVIGCHVAPLNDFLGKRFTGISVAGAAAADPPSAEGCVVTRGGTNSTAVDGYRAGRNATFKHGYVCNCIADTCARGVYCGTVVQTTVDIANVAFVGCGSDIVNADAATVRNCATTQGTLIGAAPVVGVDSATAFVDAAAGDWHLTAGSVLRGAGVNLYDGTGLQVDFDGDAFPAAGAWDIGADSYVVAASPALVLAGGRLYQRVAQPGDLRMYLAGGRVVARAAGVAGDRPLTLTAGQVSAGVAL